LKRTPVKPVVEMVYFSVEFIFAGLRYNKCDAL